MAAMTKHPKSRGDGIVPTNVYPNLASPSPWSVPPNVAGTVTIKGRNIQFGSSVQINGVDTANAQWMSPSAVVLAVNYATAQVLKVTATSPEGLVSNPVAVVIG